MKSNYIVIAILLLIAIFSFEVGSMYLPLWAFSCIAGVSIIALVFIIARIHMKHMEHLEAQLNEVKEFIRLSSQETITQIDVKADQLSNKLTEKNNLLEKSLKEHSEHMTGCIHSGNDTILKSLEGTNEHIDNVGYQIKEQCTGLGTDIRSVYAETSELKADLNERFRQIMQVHASTHDEIANLELLLQAIQKSIEDIIIIQKENEGDTIKIDRIVDEKTNNIVLNYLKDGQITKSVMQNPQGIVIYEIEFENGNITRSRSYNDKGEMTIDQIFYENGQVHHRIEYTPKGKITTEFDFNGKRK